MKKLLWAAAVGAASLALAACENERDDAANNMAAMDDGSMNAVEGSETAGTSTTTTTGAFPSGSRIVEENGRTYRIDADGTRVELGPEESRIVVENEVRYRVDPDGTRVRIGPDGAVIDIVDDDVTARIDPDDPSVEVNAR